MSTNKVSVLEEFQLFYEEMVAPQLLTKGLTSQQPAQTIRVRRPRS